MLNKIFLFLIILIFSQNSFAKISYKLADDEDIPLNIISDPLEPINRPIYGFNFIFDQTILKPTAAIYSTIMPKWGQRRVNDFMNNFHEPVNALNHLLQGKNNLFSESLWRFFINTTFGGLGLFDVAKFQGLKLHKNDLNSTFASHCIGNGIYIMLPIFGPVSTRSGVGKFGDYALNPINYTLHSNRNYIKLAAEAISTRANIMDEYDTVLRSSFDRYIAVRSVFTQSEGNLAAHYKCK